MFENKSAENWIGKTNQYLNHIEDINISQIEELRNVLRYNEWRYYVKNDPLISDFEYDQLYNVLKKIEQQNPLLVTPDSPTQRVASDLTREFTSVNHDLPMLSLENSYNEQDLIDWDKRVKGFVDGEEVQYSVEPKFDGSSISLTYDHDRLKSGVTRGNGITGENVTVNVRVIRSVPLKAGFSAIGIQKAILRGEILIDKSFFKKFNEKRMEEGLAILANPRNAAAGSMRMQDAKEVARRGLNAYVYQLAFASNNEDENQMDQFFNTHYEAMKGVDELGFKTPVNEMKVCQNIDEVIGFCREWEAKRDQFPFEIDGMVIKVNDFVAQKKCGSTAHHPRWAIAFKFKARQATTRLIDVEYQVGRTGAVTPVAKLEPVHIGGVTISSVSLFNEEVIHEKGLMIGDKVLVERAGDVIPYIVKSLPEFRKGSELEIVFPKNCPSCQSPLVKPEGEAVWRCVNINCKAQAVERIIHYVSKNAMDIDGLGEKLVTRLFDLGFISSIIDLYNLDFEKIEQLEGLGSKSVQKLKESIENSLSRDLHRLIFALGIRYVGQTTAKILPSKIDSILDLENLEMESLMAIEDIGPKVAESIREFFDNKDNIQLILNLEKRGVNIKRKQATETSQKLSGKTFLFTGTLTQLKRDEAKSLVERNGGKLLGNVSKNLDYLVVGESPGSKYKKAKSIPSISILTEEQFLQKIS
jgi:DNA ligase (NAD+)